MSDPSFEAAIKGPAAYTEEWYALRLFDPDRSPSIVLGASSAGALCGVSKYSSPYEVYCIARGLIDPPATNRAMRMGRRLEPAVLDEYEHLAGVVVQRPNRLYMSRGAPWIGATPDGIAVASDGGRWLVEAKTTTINRRDFGDEGNFDLFGKGEDDIPQEYVLQAHQQMLVTGLTRCDFAVLVDPHNVLTYTVHRNEQLIKMILDRAAEMHHRILSGDMPQPDYRHPNAAEVAKQVFHESEEYTAHLNADLSEAVECVLEARRMKAEAKCKQSEAEARLLHAMGNAHNADIDGMEYIVRRTIVPPSMWSDDDIALATSRCGSIKRSGYIRLDISKPRKGDKK